MVSVRMVLTPNAGACFFLLSIYSSSWMLSPSRLKSESPEFFSSLSLELSFSELSTAMSASQLPSILLTDSASALDLVYKLPL